MQATKRDLERRSGAEGFEELAEEACSRRMTAVGKLRRRETLSHDSVLVTISATRENRVKAPLARSQTFALRTRTVARARQPAFRVLNNNSYTFLTSVPSPFFLLL